MNKPSFNEHEAVILLDAFLQATSGSLSRNEAIKNCSQLLRRIAASNGIKIDDTFRNVAGITFQMASMESAYYGKTILKPATKLFTETVAMYKNNKRRYKTLLKEAILMVRYKNNIEAVFMSWLSTSVSSTQLSELYYALQEIEKQAKKAGIVNYSLYENFKISVLYNVRKDIMQNNYFKFTHKKQMRQIYSALDFLTQYWRNYYQNNSNSLESQLFAYNAGFYQWLIENKHFSDASCWCYINTIRDAEKYALKHSFKSVKLLEVSAEEARKTADALFSDDEFLKQNQIRHNLFKFAIGNLLAYLGEEWMPPEKAFANNTYTEQKNDTLPKNLENYKIVLEKNFPKGYRLGSSIDAKKFRRYYEETYGASLEQESEDIENSIQKLGIEYAGKIFLPQSMLNESLHKALFDSINAKLHSGVNVIYFEALFKELSDEFLDQNIYNAEMLKAYISYTSKDKYFISKSFLSDKKNPSVDPTGDVRTCLKEHGTLMDVTDLCETLSHIPSNQIKAILGSNGEFVRNSKGVYFHVDSFSVSEEDLDNIADIIHTEINKYGFISGNELYASICSKYPSIFEHNSTFSILGWRNALKYKLNNRFSFSGNIISSKDKEISMSDVFETFSKEQKNFTLSELTTFAETMGSTIYFDALYNNSARVSHNQFVPKTEVSFQVKETDNVLNRFCTEKHLPLSKIKDFGTFPEASHPWTPYLLEHYIAFHSQNYYLLHGGYNRDTVVGAMIKKENEYTNFDDLITDTITQSEVKLQKKDVLDFLFDNGYIARRTYTNIEEIIIKAQAKRNQKEK